MHRPAAHLLLLLLAVAVLAAGCSDSKPGESIVTPTPTKIVGSIPKPAVLVGHASAGKTVFTAQGCAACHTFTPAAAKGTVGPDLDKLARYAQKANRGDEKAFTNESIVDPNVYVESGYPKGVMPQTYSSLSPQQLADLVAFLTQGH